MPLRCGDVLTPLLVLRARQIIRELTVVAPDRPFRRAEMAYGRGMGDARAGSGTGGKRAEKAAETEDSDEHRDLQRDIAPESSTGGCGRRQPLALLSG